MECNFFLFYQNREERDENNGQLMSSLSQNKVTYIQCQQTEVNLFIFTAQNERQRERTTRKMSMVLLDTMISDLTFIRLFNEARRVVVWVESTAHKAVIPLKTQNISKTAKTYHSQFSAA